MVDGTTITPGAPATTVDGKAVSLGSGGELVVGTQTTDIASVTAFGGGGGGGSRSTGTTQVLPYQGDATRLQGTGMEVWMTMLLGLMYICTIL